MLVLFIEKIIKSKLLESPIIRCMHIWCIQQAMRANGAPGARNEFITKALDGSPLRVRILLANKPVSCSGPPQRIGPHLFRANKCLSEIAGSRIPLRQKSTKRLRIRWAPPHKRRSVSHSAYQLMISSSTYQGR